ncbi:MAG: hypothetical protein IPM34_01410 [Saprospiraceae bacterium]|nr:hypothetical protein [Saprospiraceae bacterium]
MSAKNNNHSKSFVDLVVETQSSVIDQFVDATKKLTKDVPFVHETLDKGNKMYKDALTAQADMIEKTTAQLNETSEHMKQTNESVKNYFQEWFDNQMNWAKNSFQMQQDAMAKGTTPNPADWANQWQNWTNQFNGYWAKNMNTAPFYQMMSNNPFMNGMNMQNQMNDHMGQWGQYYKNYLDLMNQSFGEWWNKMPNLTAADSFHGMNKMSESLSKFYELWAPMFKSIENSSFNFATYKEMMNADKYKAFVDKFFSFLPDDSRKQFDEMNKQFVQSMKQFSEMGLSNFHQMKSQMQQLPWMQTSPFNQMVDMYTNWKNAMIEATSPVSRLFEENSNVKNAKIWNEIYDRMVMLNLKNSELQYLVYQNSLKVMDALAEKVSKRIENGETIDSIVKLFQEWMMLGDEKFTTLFQGDEYSKLMTEVSSLQLKIKQDLDVQMEKMFFSNMPVATRTEMDEVYKNLYDLKKMYRNLEHMLSNQKEEPKNEAKTSKKK